MRAAATLCLALATTPACSTPTSTPAYDDSSQAPLSLSFDTDPPPGPDGVWLDATVVITMDDFPDPDTASFGPILLRSGKSNFDADIKVDLVHQAIRVHGRAALQAGTVYEVVVDTTVAGLDERTLYQAVVWTFTTGHEKANAPALPPVTWSQTIEGFLATREPNPPCPVDTDIDRLPQKGCAPFCHTSCGASGDLREPTRQLDLSDPNDPIYGLINVPTVGLVGTAAAIPRVLPGDAARSSLMRKLLGGGQKPNLPLDAPYPMVRVDGKRMPLGACGAGGLDDAGECSIPGYASDYFAHPLPFAVLELIERWIDGGALL